MMFTNTGNLALPLVLLAFGEAAMPAIIVIFVVSQFLHFTLGFYILDRHARVLNPLRLHAASYRCRCSHFRVRNFNCIFLQSNRSQHQNLGPPPMMFTNTGNLALPLVLLAFGEAAMPAIIVIFVVSQFLHFTLGFYILDRHARVLNRISVPTIIATLAGIGVGMTDVHIPALILIPMEMLGQIVIPMVLFALGVRMQDVTTNDLRVGITAAILCPVTGLALAYCLQPILQLDALQWSVFLVFAALPPAVLNYMVAERYNQEPSRVASIVLIGNIGAIVWMPLALALAPTF